MNTKAASNRKYEFDRLRVAATLAVFLYHSSRFFNQRDWHVKNVHTYAWVDFWCMFAMSWLMPLFFMISGVSLFYTVGKSGGFRKFYTDKFLRLMIPVMVASVTHCALQVYFERVTHGLFYGSFFAFIPHYFNGIYQGIGQQGGNFAFLGMHLWYLFFLFIDSLIFYRLFMWLKNSGNALLNRFTSLSAVPGLIYIWFSLPLMIMYATLPPQVLTIGAGDWGFFYYLWFLLAGFMLVSSERLCRCIRSQRWISLILGVALSILYLGRLIDPSRTVFPAAANHWSVMAVSFLCTWCWLFAILGFGMHRLNVDHPLLRYANEGVLPFYILHQSVLLGIGYFVMNWKIHAVLRWALVFSAAFAVIITLYSSLIRKLELLRFLFGLKTTHPFFLFFRKKGALVACQALYVGLILFAAGSISIDRAPMPLTYDATRDILLTSRSITAHSPTGAGVVNDAGAFAGEAVEFSSGANERIQTEPEVYVDMQFSAPAGRYIVWLRGKSDRDEWADSVWFQVDDHIGTSKGNFCMGNWLSIHPPGLYAWAGDGDRPITIHLKHGGDHKIRIQPRQIPHRIDQIWLSSSQPRIPDTRRPVAENTPNIQKKASN